MPNEKLTAVPSEIAVPILERFTYVSNEELSNAFVKLLSSASNIDTLATAHPGFIHVIDRLSPDEAKILTYLKTKSSIPTVDIKLHEDMRKGTYKQVIVEGTSISKKVELIFPDNAGLYLDNLVSLALLTLQDFHYTDIENEYKELEEMFQEKLYSYKDENQSDEIFERRIDIHRRLFLVTTYGELFIKACVG